MKALSIKQPWASLIAHGIKDIENRTWKTNFRGRIYIHASGAKVIDCLRVLNEEQYLIAQKHFLQQGLNKFSDLPTSAIIGEVDIVDCVINHDSIWADKMDNHQYANESLHIYNWVLANHVLYDKPILNVKGKLSFWEPQANTVCMNCGDPLFGQEPQYCCNGRDCGCMGQPTEPVVCSKKCYDKLMNK